MRSDLPACLPVVRGVGTNICGGVSCEFAAKELPAARVSGNSGANQFCDARRSLGSIAGRNRQSPAIYEAMACHAYLSQAIVRGSVAVI